MAYDGEGHRVALQVSGGTPTYYLGGLEEISGSTLTKYLSAAGLLTAERVGTSGPLTYLAADGLGSISEALDGSGNVAFQQLYAPFGSGRYSNGTSPTTYAFTGQRSDSASGLDYYSARYYDPVAGQFDSADTLLDGLDRYAYVGGNPESATDPSGHDPIPIPIIPGWAGPGVAIGLWIMTGHADDDTEANRAANAHNVAVYCGAHLGRCPNPNTDLGPDPHPGGYRPVVDIIGPDPLIHHSPIVQPSGGGGGGVQRGRTRHPQPPAAVPVPLPGFGGSGGQRPPPAFKKNNDPCDESEPGYTYQTYTVTHQDGRVYSGMASGEGTPYGNIKGRFQGGGLGKHPTLKEPGWGNPILDRSSDFQPAIRGREQQLIDYYRSQGLGDKNIRNSISPDRNECRGYYLAAATAEFGEITADPRLG